jgi:teichuronic acid biosynthesis glycosyltransferase TuaG
MISVLIPIYNGIEFIDESVSSVLNQTFTDWEILIGINGHPKNSNVYNIAKCYEKKSDKIRVFDFYEIKGKQETLNKMIKECSFDYIAILDVDDIWYPEKLEMQSKYLGIYDVIGTQCVYFGSIENTIPYIPVGDISDFDFFTVDPIINSSSVTRKTLCWWDPKFNIVDDYDLWLRLRKQKKTFYNIPCVLVKHRIHNESAFNTHCTNEIVQNLINYHREN